MAFSREAVMRCQPALSAIAILAVVSLAPVSVWAQASPSTDQIVKSLTPTSTMGTTRGIRIAPGGSTAGGSTAGGSAAGGSAAPGQAPQPAAAKAPAVSMT